MAFLKTQLLKDLINLRNTIYEEDNILVCNDDALEEMALKKPLKNSDFQAITGLDTSFNNYADKFLEIIRKHEMSEIKEVKVSRNAYKVLNHYKDRLSNISKTNQNLYLGKIEKIRSFDLNIISEEIIKFITTNSTEKIKLNLSDNSKSDLTILYRATNKNLRETGSYNLYITYPYIEGNIKKENFNIKAPLLYFPVILERNKKDFYLIKDQNKDILFNRDLLLLASKLENNKLDIITPNIKTFNYQVLINEVIPFYERFDIKIINKPNSLETIKFENILKEDFNKKQFKNFEFKPYLTLGRFQPYSSMIQKDMAEILAKNKYNELLEGLIDEKGLYEESDLTFKQLDTKPIDESKILYINDLNDSQEKVIDLLNKEKRIVIWGPPGTGKSQTITSLISSSVLKGENVLVVSEKKVALDVIYSRLNSASKYAMFIDDVENKNNFYNQLKQFLDPTMPIRTKNNDLYTLESEINYIINTLDKSLKLIYGNNNVDIPLLYERYLKDNSINENLTPLKVYEMFNEAIPNISFDNIKILEETFTKNKELEEYIMFQKIINNYSLINKIDTKISRSGKIELEKFHKKYLEVKNIKHRFFKKRRAKKMFINNNIDTLSFFIPTKRARKKYLKLLFKDDTFHQFIIDNTLKIDKYMTKHQKLTNLHIKYLNMFIYHPLIKNIENNYTLRKYLFDAYYTGYVENFKAKNQKYLYIMDDYFAKSERLYQLINEKITVTSESFEMELFKHAFKLANTKRIMDIRRIIESKERLSVKRFIDVFEPELMENIKIWMMTPEAVSSVLPLRYGMFDLVIFDEASQMYVEKGIPSIYRAKKVVIAGDPKQLRPSSLGMGRINDNDDLYENEIINDIGLDAKSLLDLARYKYKEALLNYHYRSYYEELIAFSNNAFYDGKLIVSPNQKQSLTPPIEYHYVKDGKFINRTNHEEAKEVIKIIKKIFRERKNNESIGVITFNNAQRDLIESYIDKEIFSKNKYQKMFEAEIMRQNNNSDQSLFVKNIENVQGDERDIIIFSMGYAKDDSNKLMRRFGWLNHEGGENRLNVAITRAKQKIYFVSSLYPEEFKVDDLTSNGPKLLKDFMRYCYFISNNNYDLAKVVLNQLHETEADTQNMLISNLAADIKTRLERNNFKVKQSIGIGKETIDLVIYDEETNENLLGIICDLNDKTNFSARKDLLHQEKYLKARGWTIYRVLSSNWYVDSNQEMKNIRNLLKK